MVAEYLSIHLAVNIGQCPLLEENIGNAMRTSFLKVDDAVLQKIARDVSRLSLNEEIRLNFDHDHYHLVRTQLTYNTV